MRPDVAAERDGEETTVLMMHGHELGKQGNTRCLRATTLIVGLVESPELLSIVPSQEVRVVLEEELEGFEVGVLDVGVTAAGGLTGEPHVVELADGSPRHIGTYGTARHAVHVCGRVVAARQRQIHAYIRSQVGRDEVDDFLWVGTVPHIDMDEPQRVLVVDGTAFLCLHAQTADEQHSE